MSGLATTSDGAVIKFKDNNYVWRFYDKDNKDKSYRKYSNYGNKYLNYYHLNQKDKDDEYYKHTQCLVNSSPSVNAGDPTILLFNWDIYKSADESNAQGTKKKIADENNNEKRECDKFYIYETRTTNEKKNLYNSWVITIVFGCFIFVLDIGLAIFGFLILKTLVAQVEQLQ